MTLIEMVVALGVTAIMLLPLAGVFYTGIKTDSENRQYGDAVALADAALAQANAVVYSSLGFYENQIGPGFNCPQTIPTYNSQVSVDLGCSAPNGTPALARTQSLQVGYVHFTLTTYVVWADGSGSCPAVTPATCSQAYKQVYAVVTWNSGGQTMTTTQNLLVYPGGLGRYTGPGASAPGATVNVPPSVTMTASTSVTSSSATVNWNDPGSPEPGFYEVLIQNSSAQPSVNTCFGGVGCSGTASGWDPQGATVVGTTQATSLVADNLSPSTTYTFVVVAFSSDGSMWAVSTNSEPTTTTSAVPPACALTSLIVNQTGQVQVNTVTVKNGNGASHGHLENAVTITVAFQGSCTGSNVVVVSATGPASLGPYTLTYSSSPAQYTYNPPTGLCPSTAFSTGSYVFSVKLDGASQTPTANVAINSVGGSPSC